MTAVERAIFGLGLLTAAALAGLTAVQLHFIVAGEHDDSRRSIRSALSMAANAVLLYAEDGNGGLIPAFDSERPPHWLSAVAPHLRWSKGVRLRVPTELVGSPIVGHASQGGLVLAEGAEVERAFGVRSLRASLAPDSGLNRRDFEAAPRH